MWLTLAGIKLNILNLWSWVSNPYMITPPSPAPSNAISLVEESTDWSKSPSLAELPATLSVPMTFDELDRLLSHTTLQRIGEGIQNATYAIFPKAEQQSRYSQVSVLLLCWEDEDPKLPVFGELCDLSNTFHQSYQYEVETWLIPSEHSCRKLSRKVLDFVDLGEDGKDHLKIVYYGGHGRLGRDKKLWFSNLPDIHHPRYRTLPWSGIQNLLEQAHSDVLILLDCCAAGFPNTNQGEGVTEMIAASAFNVIANGVGPYSFTSALSSQLNALCNSRAFTIALLYNNMLQSMQQKYEAKLDLYKAPIHLVLTQNTKFPRSIQLSPLSPPRISPACELERNGEGETIHLQTNETAQTFNSTRPRPQLNEFPRINLSIQLAGDLNLTEDLLIEWLRMFPAAADHVKVEAGWSSFSTLLIVSLPIAFWRYLPADPAVHLVGLIRSSNLLVRGLVELTADDMVKDNQPEEAFENPNLSLAESAPIVQNDFVLSPTTVSPKYSLLHRVYCPDTQLTTISTDLPIYMGDQSRGLRHLQGSITVHNLQSYLDCQISSPFVVLNDYECNYSHPRILATLRQQSRKGKLTEVEPSIMRSSIRILSEELVKELNALVKCHPSPRRFPVFDTLQEIDSPYIFYYQHRTFFQSLRADLPTHSKDLGLFLDYIHDSVADEYAEVDTLLEKGHVTAQFIPYLFSPMEILVTNKSKDTKAYLQVTALEAETPLEANHSQVTWKMMGESWIFDGTFRKKRIPLMVAYEDPTVPFMEITDLNIYPLSYARHETEKRLRNLGAAFWRYRTPSYVSYSGVDSREELYAGERFMIDMMTYRKMHTIDAAKDQVQDELGIEEMERDQPPEGDFTLLLPHEIIGFHMINKKWVTLRVECIHPVSWNKLAFEDLALDNVSKEFITAMISQRQIDNTDDIIARKGHSLIMLLHGPPGTGKTLTAECIAEIVERPLYRVTCGDIGTEAKEIEGYLETVLFLGEKWGAVVLLDEADVFVEERSLLDLKRNALVSVFLRVLEYYQGILILTTNRVGSFDEAFRSRVQLALHYVYLNESQRHKIWMNFIRRLTTDDADAKDLLGHVDDLAKLRMNGREIRNALITARQLASYKGDRLSYAHLKHCIELSAKFSAYLNDLKGGNSSAVEEKEDWVR